MALCDSTDIVVPRQLLYRIPVPWEVSMTVARTLLVYTHCLCGCPLAATVQQTCDVGRTLAASLCTWPSWATLAQASGLVGWRLSRFVASGSKDFQELKARSGLPKK